MVAAGSSSAASVPVLNVAAQSEEMENDVEYAHASMAGMGITPATAEMGGTGRSGAR